MKKYIVDPRNSVPSFFSIQPNNVVEIIPNLDSEWSLSFGLQLSGLPSNWGVILHVTYTTADGEETLLTIWQQEQSFKIWICNEKNCQSNDQEFVLAFDVWKTIEINQNSGVYTIFIDEVLVFTEPLTEVIKYADVKVFASTDHHVPAIGFIREYELTGKEVTKIYKF